VSIDQRWKELDIENQLTKKARSLRAKYKPLVLSNGDTPEQLLARAKYALYKMPHQWTITQIHRISLLFQMYPKIERTYRLAWDFRKIHEITSKSHALNARSAWMEQAKDASI
jgi:transposase